ncbi:hypothetical protein LCGC14_2175200, partial [marine sediment metagenome]
PIDSIRKNLILGIIASNDLLLGLDNLMEISNLLFGVHTRRSGKITLNFNYLKFSFLKRMKKSPAGTLDQLISILYSVEKWTTNDFDNNINLVQLAMFKLSVFEKVNTYIEVNLANYGDRTKGFHKQYGVDLINDQFEVAKAIWLAIAYYVGNNKISFYSINLRYKGTQTPVGYIPSRLTDYSKILGKNVLSNYLNLIDSLIEEELLITRRQDINYDKIFAYDNALRAILEYTGIYHFEKTRSQVQNTLTHDLLIDSHQYLTHKPSPSQVSNYVNPQISTNGLLTAYEMQDQGLYNHLQLIDMWKGFPDWISSIPVKLRIEKTFNKKLLGLTIDDRKTLTTRLLEGEIVKQYTKTTQNPKLIQQLLDAAELVKDRVSKDLDPDDAHKEIRKIISERSPLFLGGEIPVWITLHNTYTGLIDILLYDPETKTIYVVDYKPDLDYNDFRKNNFVVSIPQLAAYGLTEEDLIDIQVECIMFNDAAAWVFDPNEVLAPIDAFMLEIDDTWVPPWLEFSNLVLFKKMFRLY